MRTPFCSSQKWPHSEVPLPCAQGMPHKHKMHTPTVQSERAHISLNTSLRRHTLSLIVHIPWQSWLRVWRPPPLSAASLASPLSDLQGEKKAAHSTAACFRGLTLHAQEYLDSLLEVPNESTYVTDSACCCCMYVHTTVWYTRQLPIKDSLVLSHHKKPQEHNHAYIHTYVQCFASW